MNGFSAGNSRENSIIIESSNDEGFDVSEYVRNHAEKRRRIVTLPDDRDGNGDVDAAGSDSDSGSELPEVLPGAAGEARRATTARLGVLLSPTRHGQLVQTAAPDRPLQQLLWSHDFKFQLKPYQFEAARRVAGVPDHWPDAFPLTATDPGHPNARERGLMLADEMGLGKTVETFAGLKIRAALAAAAALGAPSASRRTRPFVVVAPNDAVAAQWLDHARNLGFPQCALWPSRTAAPAFWARWNGPHRPDGLVLTKYKLGTAAQAFQMYQTWGHNGKGKAPEDPRFKRQGWETSHAQLLRIMLSGVPTTTSSEPAFDVLILDESHELRNAHTLWSIGALAVSLHAARTVCLTGTPYNNREQDMATQMAFIAPSSRWALEEAWKNSLFKQSGTGIRRSLTGGLANDEDVMAISDWHKQYFLRRTLKQVVQNGMLKLPEKTISNIDVNLYGTEEMTQYLVIETSLRYAYRLLGRIDNETEDPVARRKKRALLRRSMALVQLSRMMLLHVACRSGSRILTTMFAADGNRQDPCKACSFCTRVMTDGGDEEELDDGDYNGGGAATSGTGTWVPCLGDKFIDEGRYDYDDDFLDRVEDDDFDDHELEFGRAARKDLGQLIEDPACQAKTIFASKCRHFIHKRCLGERGDEVSCYHCEVLKKLVHPAGTAASSGGAVKSEPKPSLETGSQLPASTPTSFAPMSLEFHSTKRWSQQYSLNPSIKMTKVAAWVSSLPKSDKFIIFSYFISFLDLMEAMLTRDAVKTYRFDGDTANKAKVLADFCEKPAAKVRGLLATISSGGIGLNITAVCMNAHDRLYLQLLRTIVSNFERTPFRLPAGGLGGVAQANHVLFADRWFNPQVHAQAEARAHRIGQKKPVTVAYIDATGTIDTCMKDLMKAKTWNAKMVLRDGTEIGTLGSNINGQDIRNRLSAMLNDLAKTRQSAA